MKKLQLKVINPVPNIDLLSTCWITQGFQDKKWKKILGFYFKETYSTFHKDFLNWYVHFPFWQKLGRAVFDRVVKDKKLTGKIYNEHKRIGQSLYSISDEIIEGNINKLTNQQIFHYLEKIIIYFKEICFYGMVPVAIDFENNYLSGWLESKVTGQIKKYQIKKPAQELISLLATPHKLTFAQKEKFDFLKLAIKRSVQREELAKHCKKYFWINYGYTGSVLPTLADYQKRLNRLKKGKQKPAQLLRELIKEKARIKINQAKISRQLHIDQKTQRLFQAAQTFMFLKVYRQEVEYKGIYAYDLLFEELGKRLGFNKKQFHYMTPQEIIGLGQGKEVDKKEINCRIKTFFAYTHIRGKGKFYYSQKARQIFKGNLYEEKIDKSIKQFSGMAAFLGKVSGKVKIVNTANEMKKVKNGDILVSIATNPSIVPAMKKAAAFVTDTGGITCHAAIVAREMKKPCIIGTKIATKVLKDGDWVEVDANKGIIRKI